MDDFDRLVAAAHERGLRVILDLVLNHTSDRHPWFVDSRSSRDNAHADWYLWRDPAGWRRGKPLPPNNWASYSADRAGHGSRAGGSSTSTRSCASSPS